MVFEYLKKTPNNSNNPQNTQENTSNVDGTTHNGSCYDSSSFKESCHTNEKGELVCNREKQVWKHCMNQKPVLISSEKEDNVPGDVREYSNKVAPFEFQEMDKEFENVFNGFMGSGFLGNDFMGKMLFNPFQLFGQDPFGSFPVHGSSRPPNPPNRPDFPEPEHWRK